MSVAAGDKITAWFDGILTCGTVWAVSFNDGLLGWSPIDGSRRRNVRLDEEGVTWIRGWHVEGSEEIQALRAAKKLYDSAERDTSPTVSAGNGGAQAIPIGALVALTVSSRFVGQMTVERAATVRWPDVDLP